MIIVFYIVMQTAQGVEISLLWSETLMISLAHYFTSRRFVPLSPALLKRLERDGELESDANPLYLPKHSIRVFIIAAFVWLAYFLYQKNRLLEPQALAVLGTVGAYFLGIIFKFVMKWRSRRSSKPTPFWWINLKAIVALTVISITVALQLLELGNQLPFDLEHLENATLGLVLFYFGSR